MIQVDDRAAWPTELAFDVLDPLLEGCQVIGFDLEYLYVNDAAALPGQRSKRRAVWRNPIGGLR